MTDKPRHFIPAQPGYYAVDLHENDGDSDPDYLTIAPVVAWWLREPTIAEPACITSEHVRAEAVLCPDGSVTEVETSVQYADLAGWLHHRCRNRVHGYEYLLTQVPQRLGGRLIQ